MSRKRTMDVRKAYNREVRTVSDIDGIWLPLDVCVPGMVGPHAEIPPVCSGATLADVQRLTGRLVGLNLEPIENPEAIQEASLHGTDEFRRIRFRWRKPGGCGIGLTVRAPSEPRTKYSAPMKQAFMVDYGVGNLRALLSTLRNEGVRVVGKVEEYSKFEWIMDPEE